MKGLKNRRNSFKQELCDVILLFSHMNKNKSDSSKTLYILIAIVIIAWITSIPILFNIFTDPNERGVFGDMFGAINALFSGLALAGIIYTIFLQKHELSLQRKELEYTRKELTRSAEAQEKSEAALRDQVHTMEKTAKLNGLSSIINHYGKVAEVAGRTSPERSEALRQSETCINQITELFEE
jgi:hypothetical protein